MLIRVAQQVSERRDLKLSHSWVPLDKMAPSMPVAVIASEDANFLSHHGFDFKAIQNAVERNAKHPEKRKLCASTISQQTAKNVFLWPRSSWVRKGFEAYFTVLIEVIWDKHRIMEVYLNTIEMGDGIYGAEAVAREHFGCAAKDLNKSQCALIAASLPNPLKFNSGKPSSYMYRRQTWILRQMRNLQKFPEKEKE
jgi:monofunctional biosynthetic peptidoglycan transglycosylase